MANNYFETVLSPFFGGIKKKDSKGNYTVTCPCCGHDHLEIKIEGESFKAHCWHCDAITSEVLQKLKESGSDISAHIEQLKTLPNAKKFAIDREHFYHDRYGKELYKKVILKDGNGKKTAIWKTYNHETRQYDTNNIPEGCHAPLFRIDEILKLRKTNPNMQIVITEGEKDATSVTVNSHIPATCLPNGALGKTTKIHDDWLDPFADAEVIILSDNDDRGRTHGKRLATALTKIAKSVKWIQPDEFFPDKVLHEKDDITDLYDRFGIADVDNRLHELIESHEVFTPEVKAADNTSARLTIPALSAELETRHIEVRLNVITQEIDVESEEPVLFKSLVIRLHSELINIYKGVTFDILTNYLSEIALLNQYNPVLDHIASIQYDGKDHLAELYALMGIDGYDDTDHVLSQMLIHKWLYQGIALLHNNDFEPIAPEGVLTLQGDQGCGKTSLLEKLAIKKSWFKRGACIDPKDKDTIRRACTNFIIELGEVETTLKSDIENLKNFITNSFDEYRVAYGHFDIRHARRSNLSATCNSDRYLIDPTGNRRWWTIKIEKTMLYDDIQQLDTEQLWSQVYNEYQQNGAEWFRLTSWEQTALAIRNNVFEKPMKAESEILDILAEVEQSPDLYIITPITASNWKAHFDSLHMLTVDQIGKALHKLGYDAVQKRVDGIKGRFYELPILKSSVYYKK